MKSQVENGLDNIHHHIMESTARLQDEGQQNLSKPYGATAFVTTL